jgi:hypothetical protein
MPPLCVLFTRDTITKAYREKPNDELTVQFPCFGVSDEDLKGPFPDFVARALTEPDPTLQKHLKQEVTSKIAALYVKSRSRSLIQKVLLSNCSTISGAHFPSAERRSMHQSLVIQDMQRKRFLL